MNENGYSKTSNTKTESHKVLTLGINTCPTNLTQKNKIIYNNLIRNSSVLMLTLLSNV